MELWFIYALASTVLGGLHMFFVKMASERGHDASFSTLLSSAAAALIAWAFVFTLGISSDSWKEILLFAAASGVLYAITCITRIESLRRIDTTIFFPLYNTFGPIFAVLLGFLVFGERFTWWEFGGILLSITVPLLLIHKEENTRQKALWHSTLLFLLYFQCVSTKNTLMYERVLLLHYLSSHLSSFTRFFATM